MKGMPISKDTGTNKSKVTTMPQPFSRHWPWILFLLVAVTGLFFVKWNPYYHKALLAASKHFIGLSILSGSSAAPPAPSWGVAWGYATVYFKSVWQAVLLGLVLGSFIEALLPREWLQKYLGSSRYRSTALGGLTAIPSMMCTCCAAPVTVGMRRQSVSVGSALAYWLGNPVLNPATIVFMSFILSWQLVALRLAVGFVLVFGVTYLADRLAEENAARIPERAERKISTGQGNLLIRWLHSFWRLALDSLPVYLLMVLLLGAFRAWLFPAGQTLWGSGLWHDL